MRKSPRDTIHIQHCSSQLGPGFVLSIVYRVAAHRSMWTVTNYFLLNLTVSDIMMATFNCIPSFIYMRDR